MFNFNRNPPRSSSRNQGGFMQSVWSFGAFAALTSFTFSMLAIVYLTRHAIEANDEMIMRACLASPLFLLAGILSLGLMAKQASKYFADGYHAANQQPAQLPMLQNTAETIDAIARLVQQQLPNGAGGAGGYALPQLPAPTRHLMDALRNEECVLVWGQKGAGKTTVLLHLIRQRIQSGHDIVVCDPHASPRKWLDAPTIGGGRKFEAIEETLNGFVALMNERYEEINKGIVLEGEHPCMTVIVDEYRAINMNTDTSKESIKTLLTEARKTNIFIAVISHSKGVKALGFKGESDLKEGLCIVHLLKDAQGQRRAEVSYNGEKPDEMVLPGPFTGQVQYRTSSIPSQYQPANKPISTQYQAHTSAIPSPYQPDTNPVPAKKELSAEEAIKKLRNMGKSEMTIARYLAKKYPKLSGNAISQLCKLSRNKALAIVKTARQEDSDKEHQKGHQNGYQNGRVTQ